MSHMQLAAFILFSIAFMALIYVCPIIMVCIIGFYVGRRIRRALRNSASRALSIRR